MNLTATVKDAERAAIRYAQLVSYHDHASHRQYVHDPYCAWQEYCRQFRGTPKGVLILVAIGRAFSRELRRLAAERKRTNVEGQSPTPQAGKWNQP
jgi:hypothetical protein